MARPSKFAHVVYSTRLYYQDPDGNRMEFQVDCGTVEEANAYMQTDAFAANPAWGRN
jgi:hypothetical protein